jgi:hypothetical protein
LNAAALQSLIGRVAAVLNEDNPNAFAFLQSGYYKGIADEVKDFHLELERAAERFNSNSSCMRANVLRRQELQEPEEDTPAYWNEIDGVLLSASLA